MQQIHTQIGYFVSKKIQNPQVGADKHLFQLQYKYKKWLNKTRVFKNQTGFDKNKQNVAGDLMGKYLNLPQVIPYKSVDSVLTWG